MTPSCARRCPQASTEEYFVDVSVVELLASEAVVELAARARGVEEEIRLLSGSR